MLYLQLLILFSYMNILSVLKASFYYFNPIFIINFKKSFQVQSSLFYSLILCAWVCILFFTSLDVTTFAWLVQHFHILISMLLFIFKAKKQFPILLICRNLYILLFSQHIKCRIWAFPSQLNCRLQYGMSM